MQINSRILPHSKTRCHKAAQLTPGLLFLRNPRRYTAICSISAPHLYNPLYIMHKTLPTEPALLGRTSIENTQMTRYNRDVWIVTRA